MSTTNTSEVQPNLSVSSVLKAISLKDLLQLAESETLKYYYIACEQPNNHDTK